MKYISSLPEGLDAQVILKKFKETNKNFLFICRDDRRLEAVKAALLFFDPNLNFMTIPAWDCAPYETISPNPALVSKRLASLVKIVEKSEQKVLYLTTLNAAAQYFPPQEIIKDCYLNIVVGKKIDDQFLIKILLEFGYIKTSIVSEPGEFSVRGGIIDIFTSGPAKAVRLDFFGDTVDKLRTFDVSSQLSINNVRKIQLLPISEIIINDETVKNFRKNFRKNFGVFRDQNELYTGISEKRRIQGIEQWLPLFYDNLESLFDYLPDATYFLDHDIKNNLLTRWDNINSQFDARTRSINKHGKQANLSWCDPKTLYISPDIFDELLDIKNVFQISLLPLPPNPENLNAMGKLGRKFFVERQREDIYLFEALNIFLGEITGSKDVIIATSSEGSRTRLLELLKDEGNNNFSIIENFNDVKRANNRSLIYLAIWPLEEGFSSEEIAVVYESDIFGKNLYTGQKKSKRSRNIITDAMSLEIGDAVIHIDHGIGRFHGFQTILTNDNRHECLLIEYAENSKLFLPVENIELLSRHGNGLVALDKLGGASWQKRKSKLKAQILEMADTLIKTAAVRQLKHVEPIELPEPDWQKFCSKFNYLETDDQNSAINEIIDDFKSGISMDRLICGDVGFGKTEIAMRAAYIVAMSGMQVAIICPTTLLSRQHQKSFLERYSGTPVCIEQLSRLTPKNEINNIKKNLKEGRIDIIIGTHSLLSDNVEFSNLGLLIIDEEQHFGVTHKEKLKNIRNDVHVLTLTATPIPRTLNMSLSGLKDLSIIATPPVDRLAIRTYVLEFDVLTVRQALLREHYRGGQSFIVVPRIKDIARLEDFLIKNVPELSFVIAHAKLPASELDLRMNQFYDKEFNILLATTIIESGLDISSANTIIIHNADMFGLSQLYQLRGRVGRSKLRAYAYLTTKKSKKINSNARKRLKVISSLSDLGAGFNLASQDLDLRGAGNILGDAQSGHIREVGYELYHSLLDEAILTLKAGNQELESEYQSEWTPKLNLGMSVLIPEEYIPETTVRLDLYKKLSELSSKIELEGFASQLIDRFGPLPKEINSLLSVIQIKSICKKIGINQIDVGVGRIIIDLRKTNKLNTDKLLDYIKENTNELKVKNNKLVYMREWRVNKDKVKVIFVILKELRKLCDNL
ncbi:MAG: transcription-repair coupling factor [Paracoccaceae bacterium]|nr:transcription-repair coupling factor [Paracoccaceae bacterium]